MGSLNGAHLANAFAIPLCEYNCAEELITKSPKFSIDQNLPLALSEVVGLNLPIVFSNQFMVDLSLVSPVNNPSRDLIKEGIAVRNPPTAFVQPQIAPAGVKYGAIINAVFPTTFPILFSILSESNISNLFKKVPSTVRVSLHLTISLLNASLFPSNSV